MLCRLLSTHIQISSAHLVNNLLEFSVMVLYASTRAGTAVWARCLVVLACQQSKVVHASLKGCQHAWLHKPAATCITGHLALNHLALQFHHPAS
jgi:hypothetical protein